MDQNNHHQQNHPSSSYNNSSGSSRHPPYYQQQQQQQQPQGSSQHFLPPPSQLNLQSGVLTSPSSNILPPIPNIPSNSPPSPTNTRFGAPPPGYFPPQPQQQWSAPPLRSATASSSREDAYQQQIKRETMNQQHQKEGSVGSAGHDDAMPSTSDFVKKLYKMLEDPSFQTVVSWGPQGDCFVVKDMNEFTKSILPRMFKHSNFASFVRQLNKYDFHKVKNTDDTQFGEHSWTFRHPDFHADRRDALENIKRKVPAQRKSTASSIPPQQVQALTTVDQLQDEVRKLREEGDDLRGRLRNLERNYESVLVEMVGFQRGMAQQDGLMQSLIAYFLGSESGKLKSASTNANASASQAGPSSASQQSQGAQAQSHLGTTSDQNPFLPPSAASRIMGGRSALYPETDIGRATLMQMSELSRRAAEGTSGGLGLGDAAARLGERLWGSSAAGVGGGGGLSLDGPPKMTRADALARIEELHRGRVEQGGWAAAPLAARARGLGGLLQQNQSGQDAATDADDDFVMGSATSPTEQSSRSQTQQQQQQQQVLQSLWSGAAGANDEGSSVMTHEGLQVYTVGHLMPRSSVDDANGNWTFDGLGSLSEPPQPQPYRPPASSYDQNTGESESPEFDEDTVQPTPQPGQERAPALSKPVAAAQKIRVRRSTFVPGWAVPPRVLLVDDDAVSRKLSSKFLQVFGCTTDVAVDGVSAVNKMNLEKYDLVLMDIVMPKLDGVSATSLIRKFDHMTPIISMTSNSKPNEIMTYYSSGMNDILPKPFTKDGLLEMLEKHLMHLKVFQQMSRVSRPIGIPPLNDAGFEQALTTNASNALVSAGNSAPSPGSFNFGTNDDEGRINPLAGMGLTDEQYNMILQNIVNGEGFMGGMTGIEGLSSGGEKRPLDDSSDGRDSKRSRFEVVD